MFGKCNLPVDAESDDDLEFESNSYLMEKLEAIHPKLKSILDLKSPSIRMNQYLQAKEKGGIGIFNTPSGAIHCGPFTNREYALVGKWVTFKFRESFSSQLISVVAWWDALILLLCHDDPSLSEDDAVHTLTTHCRTQDWVELLLAQLHLANIKYP